MSEESADSPRQQCETISDLRKRLGLFSFQSDTATQETVWRSEALPHLGVRPGAIVEWLARSPGTGVAALALRLSPQCCSAERMLAIVDCRGDCYAPALWAWNLSADQTLLVRPNNRVEACWAIEQCLRCPGVSATWAWVDERFSRPSHRRWPLAAEAGGGVGFIFRPESAGREPVWAVLRLLVYSRPGGPGETRRVQIDVLYRRGGVGGTAQVWE